MVITITPDVRLRTDDHNYTLETRTVTRASNLAKEENVGKSRWIVRGHYGTLRAACRGMIDRHAKYLVGDADEEECVRSIQQVFDRIEALEKRIVRVFDEQGMVLQEHHDDGPYAMEVTRIPREKDSWGDIQLTPDDLRHLMTGGLLRCTDEEGDEYIELVKPPPEKKTLAGVGS